MGRRGGALFASAGGASQPPLALPPAIRDKPTTAQGTPPTMILDAPFYVILTGLNLYSWAVIIGAVLSMLVGFGVLDTRNRVVWAISDFFYRITEPALRPIRNRMPNLGAVDLSPLVLILLIQAAILLVAAIQGYLIRGGMYF